MPFKFGAWASSQAGAINGGNRRSLAAPPANLAVEDDSDRSSTGICG
jgi:hypothetical protein